MLRGQNPSFWGLLEILVLDDHLGHGNDRNTIVGDNANDLVPNILLPKTTSVDSVTVCTHIFKQEVDHFIV